jgi:hypothetical protein
MFSFRSIAHVRSDQAVRKAETMNVQYTRARKPLNSRQDSQAKSESVSLEQTMTRCCASMTNSSSLL